MAEGAIDTYLQTVNKQFKFHASWPPGSLVELGNIGVIKDGAFIQDVKPHEQERLLSPGTP